MKNLVVGISVLVIIAVATGVWYWHAHPKVAMHSATPTVVSNNDVYPYGCDDGSQIGFIPSDTMKSVQVVPGAKGAFTGTTTLTQLKDTHYAGPASNSLEVAIMGYGESIRLNVGSTTQTTCHPLPDQNNAPFNWGDATTIGA